METIAFDAQILRAPDQDAAYVIFPFDLRARFGCGRMKVHAAFDGVPYDGSIVNMGVRDEAGRICWVLGLRRDIRAAIGKGAGDVVHVEVTPRAESRKQPEETKE